MVFLKNKRLGRQTVAFMNPPSIAAGSGVVKGYDSEHFGPDDAVTREQMVTILYRYAQYKQYGTTASAGFQHNRVSDPVSNLLCFRNGSNCFCSRND